MKKKTTKELSPIERVIVFGVGCAIIEILLKEMLKKKGISPTEKLHITKTIKGIHKGTTDLSKVIAAYLQLGKFGGRKR